MPGDEGLLEEGLDLLPPLDNPACRQQLRRYKPFENLPSLTVRRVDQCSAIEVEHVEQVQLQRNLFRGGLDPVHASEAAHEVLERKRLSVSVHGDDLAFEQEFGRGQGFRDRDDLGKAGRDIAQPPTEDLHRLPLPMDLNARAIQLVLDGRHAAMHREDLVEVFRHLGEHRFHGSEETQAPGAEAVLAFEERDLRDHPEVPEEHVGRPHGVQVHARRIRNSFEHDALVHADPHLAEHVLQEDVPFAFRRPPKEGLQEPTARPRRVRPVGLGNLRECLRDLQDAQ